MDDDDPWRIHGRLLRSGQIRLSDTGRARLARIVRRTPEVMVKVSGKTRNPTHLKAHIDYVTRNGSLRMEHSDGLEMQGREAVRSLCDGWLVANALTGRPAPNASQSVSIVLSMAPGTDPDRVQDAARAWAHANLANHEWILVRHDDQEHPHVHVTVRAVGRDGKRLAPGKEQLQAWREDFARELRKRGVAAEATPRQARGHMQKRAPDGIFRIQERGQQPRQKWQPKERTAAPEPWHRERVELRQDAIRAAYMAHAGELRKGNADDQRLAHDIDRFVADMPVARARRGDLAQELEHVRDRRRP